MAQTTLIWKVYDTEGKSEAACGSPESAAAIVALLGEGATIRRGRGHIVWREGQEDIVASESYDIVAETCYRRWHTFVVRKHAKR